MSFHILPKDPKFFELFILDGDNLAAAATALHEMVEHYDKLESRVANIQGLEKRGDEIDDEVNARLKRSFITPFDREDIHELVVHLDDVVDGIQATAEIFVIYGITAPDDDVKQLVGLLTGQAVQLLEALTSLEGKRDVGPHLQQIHELEHKADALSRAAIGRLFKGGQDPLEVIKLRDLYSELEETIDAAEDAAEVIERILAKA